MAAPRRRLAALASLALATAAVAQEAPPAEPPVSFGEVVEVRVINVEVVVTDADGVPVRGLGPDAFRLEVDGEPQAIEYFSEVRAGVAAEGERGDGLELAEVPAVVPGEPVGTSYLLFIDELFAIDADRDEVLREMARDLPLLGPEDRMAVVAFDGRHLEMLSSWTSSTSALERALEAARERPAYGMQRLAERRQFEGRRFARPGLGRHPFAGLDPEARSYALRLGDQVERVVRAAAATLRSFARPPGRRVVLLLSGGWPFSASDFVAGGPVLPVDDLGMVEGEELYQRLADTANRLGYTIYAVSVPGAFDRLADEAAGGLVASSRRQELYTTFRYLAAETGGEAFLGADRLQALRETVADTRSYYWLGFTPDRDWDDRRHDLRVTLANPELEVRSRAGFLDVSRQTEVSMAVESALLFAGLPEAPELQVTLGEGRKAGFRKSEIPLSLSLPLPAITFVPQGDRWVARLELRFAAVDEGFHASEIPVVPIALERAAPPTAEERWTYETALRMRRRPQELLVAVYDAASGRIFTHRVRLDP